MGRIRKFSAQHETLTMQRHALVGEVYSDFKIGSRVMTIDGLPGKVTAVSDGPFPSLEDYTVLLDNGMGGGTYTSGQLRPLAETTASRVEASEVYASIPVEAVTEHAANIDYPELEDILERRLPNENIRVFAANNTADDDTDDDESDKLTQQSNDPDDNKDLSGVEGNLPTDEPVDSNTEEGDVPNVTPPSSCSFCGGVDFEDPQMTGRGTRMRCSQCGGTMKSWGGQWEPEFPNSSQNNASEQGDMRSGGVGGVAALPDSNFKTSDLQTNAGIINWVVDKIFDRIQERTEEAARGGKYHWADESHQNQVAGPPVYNTQFPWVDVPQRNPGGLTIHSSLDEGELGFHLTASWVDVQAKARRIRREGGVKIVSASKMFVVGEVQGDTEVYESQLNYVPGSKKVADWACGCKWASYSWGRSSAFRRFEGRLCSHALALQYEAGARGMFGKDVDEDQFRGTKPVVVRWDKLLDQHLTRDSALQKTGLTFSHVGEEHNMSEPRNSREGDTSWGSIHAHDTKGNRVGELDYTLNPHDDGGDIDVDGPHLAPGYEHHAPAMMHALEQHLENTRGLKGSRSWTYTDNIGHKFNPGMVSYSSLIYDSDGLYPEPQLLDLEHPPIYAFATNMAENGESLANIVQMFASFGMDRESTRQMTQEVWLEPLVKGSQIDPKRLLTASWSPNPAAGNNAVLEARTAVGELTQAADDERARKRKKHPGRTNDAREHAHVWGYGWPYGIGLMMCGQCNGSGCGHCAGTGQVPSKDESTPTQSPTDSTPDQTPDAGAAISTDGLSASLKTATMPSRSLTKGDESQPIYRSMALRNLSDIKDSIGTHWTHDLEQAKNYARGDAEDAPEEYKHFVVLEADHPGHHHVMDWNNPNDRPILHDTIMGEHHADAEPEIPIRPGAPLHLRAIHHLDLDEEDEDKDFKRKKIDQQKLADYSSADPLVSIDQGQNYYAPTPHSHSQNPASTGWATSQDPGDWGRSLISNDFGLTFDSSLRTSAKASDPYDGPTVSGVAVKAADTGRVLMIQRSVHHDDDPAKGTWEFPGGHHEEDDPTSLHAGIREWEEEIGQPFPHGGHVSHVWRSGPYQGHVVNIPSEKMVDFSQGRSELNPDDPDGDDHEQAAWWDPDHARKNPALRQELKDHSPFNEIKKAAAISTPCQTPEVNYDTTINDRTIGVTAEMPEDVNLDERQADTLDRNLHNMMEMVLAPLFPPPYNPPHKATLHDEPEGALPSTDGIVDDETGFPIDNQTSDDISSILAGDTVDGPHVSADDANSIRMAFLQTAGAQAMLRDAPELQAKVAMKDFSFAEQQELINEGKGERARNFNDLKIAGTHYELIPEDADDTILWT